MELSFLAPRASEPIEVIQCTEGAIDILSKVKRKCCDLIKIARQLKLSTAQTVQELKDTLQRYHTSLKAKYEQKNIQPDKLHFQNDQQQPSFESMLCYDENVIYAAKNDTKVLVFFQVKKDGVGLRGVNLQELIKYGNLWRKIYSLFFYK